MTGPDALSVGSATTFFGPWEVVISDWRTALDQIDLVLTRASQARELTWRGVSDASWSLHSSLYRHFLAHGLKPTEDKLVKFEQALLQKARKSWRFDHHSALESLAHIQHYGGPTRLLDVTFNPLVALWFATETKFDRSGKRLPDVDGRIFAFDTTSRQIELDLVWGSRGLPWRSPPTGWRHDLPHVWRPPSYNERIPAQNSAFLLGGVPSYTTGGNRQYRKAPGPASTMGLWRIREVLDATSVNLRMNSLDRSLRANATPAYTLRITAEAKEVIRRRLEDNYGFSVSTIYPDLFGLANNISNGLL